VAKTGCLQFAMRLPKRRQVRAEHVVARLLDPHAMYGFVVESSLSIPVTAPLGSAALFVYGKTNL
jgi:hypothetical protein